MDVIDKKLLGKRIKELRKSKGMTQETLSEIVEVDAKHLSRIESGKNLPSLVLLNKISSALELESERILSFSHLRSRTELVSDINKKLSQCNDEKLRLFYKILMNIAE